VRHTGSCDQLAVWAYNRTHNLYAQLIDDSVDIVHGLQKRRLPLRSLLRECSPAIIPADNLDPRLLASLNSVMAARRVAARSAAASGFHRFLTRMFVEGRLERCLTTSFDGLEACGDPALESKTIMLHGDNRVLRCCRRGCPGVSEEETAELDDTLLNPFASGDSPDFPGQLCGECYKKCEWCGGAHEFGY
jgi:hypothetical protein